MYQILIADDEKEIIELMTLYLENEQYQVIEAYDGIEALEKLAKHKVDLVILDVMMPKLDGFNVLKKIRETYQMPVLMLSAKSEDVNKILGLGLGADDYIAKPFNPLEVVARVNAQLRRSHTLNAQKEDKEKIISIGPYQLNTESCAFFKEGMEINLTSTEYKILNLLFEYPNRVFTRSQIFEHVWHELSEGDDHTIMVHIRKIREKIEDDPSNPLFLKTIRGLGYRFEKKV